MDKTRKLILVALVVLVSVGAYLFMAQRMTTRPPIKVGILHSLTGTMSISERSVVDATMLALEEINQSGGVLGRNIQAIVVDTGSNALQFADEAERLIDAEKVSVLFGCWTSASRKVVKEVVERFNHLLFYPVQYEGLEQSPNIIYTGAAPNQQIIPAVKWAFDHLGDRFYLVGSDYVFPRTANAMIRDQVGALDGHIVGERYVPLGGRHFESIVMEILEAQPDVIMNTINGDSNTSFFLALRMAGVTPAHIPTLSFSMAENELLSLDSRMMAGDYAAWNYFQGIRDARNLDFVEKFQRKFGPGRVTADSMESAYFSVYLWAQAVRDAQTDDVAIVNQTILDQSFAAPGGIVYVDSSTRHTWKTVRVGKIREDGQFDILWTSDHPIRPVPFPTYRTQSEWEEFLQRLYRGWGNQWAATLPNPGE
ncbi:MAG: urea ABC transporter substrate-binding protein [Nitrospirales bacterium]|nr:urea ABC transporter substrate-binding protein [Nitrospira sp.]MDR4502164.1 urea ABC transporter substrate-binding protein [Nitrospirales bacterium]